MDIRKTSGVTVICGLTLFGLAACVQIVGIDDPILVDESTGGGNVGVSGSASSGDSSSGSGGGSTSGSSSSGSSTSTGGGIWPGWRMPNPASAGLPNPAIYTIDTTKGVVFDNVTGLIWQRTLDSGSYTMDNAKAYCDNLDYGGDTDWRLPTRIELVSLVDFTRINPAIDTNAFPNTPSDSFWTQSFKANSTSTGWIVPFSIGDTNTTSANNTARVRCVR